MAAQALYRKWRSQTFDEVVGQARVTATLHNALRDGRMSHAYLFSGPRGTGKTSTARILAKAINCLAEDPAARPCNRCRICTAISEGRLLDLIEIDAASNRGIDEIRDLREKIGFRPGEARFKVYIIDEVHMLTKEAFNALLKTLEEPPPHAVFVLATTEPDRVPETVRSRCQWFDFRRISTAEIVAHLERVIAAEDGRAEDEALAAIARRATGSMRDAVSLLDQLLSYGDDILTLKRVEEVLGLVDAQAISALVDALAAHDAAAGLALINRLVAEGVELSQLVDQILAYLRGVLHVRIVQSADLLDAPQEVAEAMARQAAGLAPSAILLALREFAEARAALRDQVPGAPQLPIEIAFLRAAMPADEAAERLGSPVAAPVEAPSMLREAGARPAAPKPAVQHRDAAGDAAVVDEKAPAVADPAPAAKNRDAAGDAAAAQPAAADAGDLGDLAQRHWDRFLVLAGARCGMKVQAALRSVRRMDASGRMLVLQFAHAFARDVVSDVGNRSQVEAALQEVLGRTVVVRCALVGEAASTDAGAARAGNPARDPGRDDDVLLDDARRRGAVVKTLKGRQAAEAEAEGGEG